MSSNYPQALKAMHSRAPGNARGGMKHPPEPRARIWINARICIEGLWEDYPNDTWGDPSMRAPPRKKSGRIT